MCCRRIIGCGFIRGRGSECADGELAWRDPRSCLKMQRRISPSDNPPSTLTSVLGGPQRKTLVCLSAATSHEESRQRKSSSRIDVVAVEVAGAGSP